MTEFIGSPPDFHSDWCTYFRDAFERVGKAGVPWLPQWKRPILTLYYGRVNMYFLPILQVELISAHFAVSQNQAQWRALYLLTSRLPFGPLDLWASLFMFPRPAPPWALGPMAGLVPLQGDPSILLYIYIYERFPFV